MQTSTPLPNNDTLPQLLAYLNTSLSSYQEFPHNITKALQKLGEYSQHDRIYILEIHHNMTFDIIHEWAIKEAGPTPEKWKHAPIIHQQLWEEQLCKNDYIIIRDENNSHAETDQLLMEQNCQQMLLLPLFESGSHFAFIAFAQCIHTHNWSNEEIQMLSLLSSIIATRLNNYRLTHRMLHHLQKFHQQKIDILLHYNQLQKIEDELIPHWENIKKIHPDLSELTQIESQLTQVKKICQTLLAK